MIPRRRALILILTLLLLIIGAGGWWTYGAIQKAQKDTDLIAAIKRGDPRAVDILLDRGADSNARDVTDQRTIWQQVCDLFFRRRSAGPEASALALAVNGSDWKQSEPILLALIKHDADPNVKGDEGITPLMCGCIYHDKALINLALAHGAQVNVQNQYGATPLMEAARRRDAEMLKILLTHGADVNVKNQFGDTPLMYALEPPAPDTVVVDLLLKHDAEVNVAADYVGATPLSLAVEENRPDLVSLLKHYGAKQ